MLRFDTVTITATKTEEGFIRDKPIIGRVGLLKYKNADGSERVEYRPAEEAFSADSLSSIEGKPIMIGHAAMARADNVSKLPIVGTVLSKGVQDGDNIRADVSIYNLPTDARELSCGYTLRLDETPGEWNGQHYDAIQRDIKYNHLAIVGKGRAGVARLNMDGDQELDNFDDDNQNKNKNNGVDRMDKIRLDSGLEYECAPEVKVFVEQMRKDAAEQKKNQDGLQAKYDAVSADLEKNKKDHAEEIKKSKENFDNAVKSRVSILEVAKQHKIDKADELDDKGIKVAVIKAVRGDSFDIKDKSDDYINAAFDLCKDEAKQRNDAAAKNRKTVNTPAKQENKDQDIEDDDLDALAEKMRADEAELWKGGKK